MIWSFLVTVSLTLCWTLSPEVLVLLGNSIGQGGTAFFAALFLGAALSAMTANLLHHPSLAPAGNIRPDILSAEFGPFLAITLTLAGRLGPVLLLSTGMLVTAGFTFNETFVFWFPNFGFSFLLLLLVVALHLSGERVALAAQPMFFCLTACCLLLLSLAGLLAEPLVSQPAAVPAATDPALFSSLFPLSILLFLGYDQPSPPTNRGNRLSYLCAIAIGFLLLAFWGYISLQYVPQARLFESTVPYVNSAKAILGQPGRVIMGIAIISGACGVVNGLFYLSGRTVEQLLPGISLQSLSHHRWFRPLQAILTALAIALFMAGGLAGSENLKVYIFGTLLFWLLTIGACCLATARHLHTQNDKHSWQGYTIGAMLATVVAYLAFTYPQSRVLGSFCLLVLAASATCSVVLCVLHRRKRALSINCSKGGNS